MYLRFLITCLLLPVFCYAQRGSTTPQQPINSSVTPANYKPRNMADTPGYLLSSTDTANTTVISPLQQLWNEQTGEGKNITQEKGTAGFFNISGKSSGADVYAFHATAARGTIVRVKNLNNGRIAFVKVLGPLPATKQYAGCIIGLSDGAKTMLGVRERKSFCELSYAAY